MIRASLHDVEKSLLIAVFLVVVVVFAFLRDWRATLIPFVAVPVSLIGSLAAMYLLGYSLDNLSLMALTIATGFVVDDAIVVMENIVRHMEAGMPRFEATLVGVREVGFTVLSMSLSLIAVFIPILLMGGVMGRLFREFAITLSIAILISMVISLTTTPTMCSRLLGRQGHGRRHGWAFRWSERLFQDLLDSYERALAWALRHGPLVMLILAATIILNVVLFHIIPKGYFPLQDTGRLYGGIQADQSISFQLMSQKLKQFVDIVQADPAVATAVGTTGSSGGRGGSTNTGNLFIALKPLGERHASSLDVINRLRPKLAQVAGATLFLVPWQELGGGTGRSSNSLYQYTLQADDLDDLRAWTPKLLEALKNEPVLTDLNSDQQDKGLETDLVVDRDTASRLGLTSSQVDNALYDAFGQRSVSTIYESLNQYHVIMTVAPRFLQDPEALKDIYVSTSGGAVSGTQATNAVAGTVGNGKSTAAASAANDAARNASTNAIASTGHGSASTGSAVSTSREVMIPLAAFAHYQTGTTPLVVNHQGLFAAGTISFNLAPNASLSDAVAAVDRQTALIHLPNTVHGSFAGNANAFQQSLANEPILILAAVIAIYLVLGVLYESYAHPLTILSTLPSAGLGAFLALMLFNMEFSLIAWIGVFLLIGIVKKNAIMMIDFAIEAERREHLSPRDAIFKASLLRFRPIMMTTMAAMLGAVPLAIGFGNGAELRQPLGIAIVGGLIVSQLLTLFTTPVVYLYVDRGRLWVPAPLVEDRCRHRPPQGRRPPPAQPNRQMNPRHTSRLLRPVIFAAVFALIAGCAVGPTYRRPAVEAPAAYKEAAGWKAAAPGDAAARGAWWESFQDSRLNELEAQVALSNQSLNQAEANYEEARQLARADRATFLPSIGVDGFGRQDALLRRPEPASRPTRRRCRAPGRRTSGAAFASRPRPTWRRPKPAPPTWPRRGFRPRPSLAQDYIALRSLDEKRRLLDNAVEDYRRTLQISQNQ